MGFPVLASRYLPCEYPEDFNDFIKQTLQSVPKTIENILPNKLYVLFVPLHRGMACPVKYSTNKIDKVLVQFFIFAELRLFCRRKLPKSLNFAKMNDI